MRSALKKYTKGDNDLNTIDGKAIAAEMKEQQIKKVAELKEKGITPGLAVVLVGDDPASATYVNSKERECGNLGIYSEVYRLPADTSEEEVINIVKKLNQNKKIHGILVQLPMPGHISERNVLRAVDPDKDVDGLHVISAGRLIAGEKGFKPCTPRGIIKLIKSTGTVISGKRAVVIGRSNLVGKPIAIMLLAENATVTICHSKTQDLKEICAQADIIVAATGKPGMIKGDFIKEGAIVIDVGTTKVDGKLKGDVVFEEASAKASYITPVPGGVGPMTIRMLMQNTIEAAENNV